MKQASFTNEASFVCQWSLLHFLPQFLLLPDSNDKRYNSIIEKYQKDSNSVCLDEIQFLGDYYPKKLKNDSKFLKCCHVYYIWFLSLSLFKDFYAKTLNDVRFNFRWNVITASVSIISWLSVLYVLNGRKVTVWILYRYEMAKIYRI